MQWLYYAAGSNDCMQWLYYVAGSNGCTRVIGHFDVDAVLLLGRALSGRAKPFLRTADAPTPKNHVHGASDRTGDVRNSSQDQGDHQQGWGRWQSAIECQKRCRRIANVWQWLRLDELYGGRAEDRHSKHGRQSRCLLIQGILNARTVCTRNVEGRGDRERS